MGKKKSIYARLQDIEFDQTAYAVPFPGLVVVFFPHDLRLYPLLWTLFLLLFFLAPSVVILLPAKST